MILSDTVQNGCLHVPVQPFPTSSFILILMAFTYRENLWDGNHLNDVVFRVAFLLFCLQAVIFCSIYFTGDDSSLYLQEVIIVVFTGSNVFVFTGGDIFLCLQVVIFCCVYKQKYFGVFTGRDILLCLQAVALTDTTKWLSFDAARDYCRGVGGDLVSIHSAGENSFVQNLVG